MLDELYTKVNTTSEAVIIPERYASLVKDTADSLSAGMVCYINPASLEKIDIPQSIIGTMMFDEEGEEENKDVKEDLFYAFLKRIIAIGKKLLPSICRSHMNLFLLGNDL